MYCGGTILHAINFILCRLHLAGQDSNPVHSFSQLVSYLVCLDEEVHLHAVLLVAYLFVQLPGFGGVVGGRATDPLRARLQRLPVQGIPLLPEFNQLGLVHVLLVLLDLVPS